MVEPYNALLTIHCLINNTNISTVLDNEAIYEINQKWLNRRWPSYDNLNRIICKRISTITSPLRFDIDEDNAKAVNINSNLQELETNLVAFPRLHFMMTSMAPLATRGRGFGYCRYDVLAMIEDCSRAYTSCFTKFR